mmetsp:Transcript_30437/g.55336  ORF Transcript_30437/g.55336 Transcript_30437/m.55336 type:complete len:126 (-) Transcript_30437:600-977(-)
MALSKRKQQDRRSSTPTPVAQPAAKKQNKTNTASKPAASKQAASTQAASKPAGKSAASSAGKQSPSAKGAALTKTLKTLEAERKASDAAHKAKQRASEKTVAKLELQILRAAKDVQAASEVTSPK